MGNSLRASTVAAFAIVASCSSPTGESVSIHLLVQSDKSVYHLATDSSAQPLLVNESAVPVWAPMNEYVYVQRFENGRWGEEIPWFSVDGVGISFPIQPRDTLYSLPMDFGYVGRTPGRYRFIFEVAQDSLGRRLVSEEQRSSPPFELQP